MSTNANSDQLDYAGGYDGYFKHDAATAAAAASSSGTALPHLAAFDGFPVCVFPLAFWLICDVALQRCKSFPLWSCTFHLLHAVYWTWCTKSSVTLYKHSALLMLRFKC